MPPTPQSSAEQMARHLQREKYQRALKMVWREPDNCPICDSSAWTVGELINAPLRPVISDIASAIMAEERVYVYLPVTCVYCGHTLFFHTGVLDVRMDEQVKAVPPLRFPAESRP